MTLYHYCSTESFASIVGSKTIRLSMLNMTNDYLGGQWALRCFEAMCQSDPITSPVSAKLKEIAEQGSKMALVAGFCLSEQVDQVSQWRGYANDGTGFGIGFNRQRLKQLGEFYRDSEKSGFGFSLQRVLYNKEEQEGAFAPCIEGAKRYVNGEPLGRQRGPCWILRMKKSGRGKKNA
jgi:hypothetical protein